MRKLFLLLLLLTLPSLAFADDLIKSYRGTIEIGEGREIEALKFTGAHSEFSTLTWVSTELDLDGATEAATSLIPANATYYGCVAKVTEVVTGATSWDLGDGSNADRWADDAALTLGTKTSESDFTADPRGWSATAVSPTLTANGSNFTDGKIRISCLIQTFDANVE